MKLTKEEKHEVYKNVLIGIQSNEFGFCCAGFINVLNLWDTECFPSFKDVFSELYELRTRGNFPVWFNNREERVEALKKCIEQTK